MRIFVGKYACVLNQLKQCTFQAVKFINILNIYRYIVHALHISIARDGLVVRGYG